MKNVETTSTAAGKYVSGRPRRHHSETGRLGNEIYERDIRHKVEPDHIGEYVAIDVDSGCWVLGDTTKEARNQLEDRRPKAVNVLMKRVGYVAVGSFGGRAPRRTASSVVQSDKETQTQPRQEDNVKYVETTKNTTEGYVPRRPSREAGEIGRLGREIYDREIRKEVEPEHIGKIIAIDVESGIWVLGGGIDELDETLERLRKQRPEAVDVYSLRIGYEAMVGFGGSPRRIA